MTTAPSWKKITTIQQFNAWLSKASVTKGSLGGRKFVVGQSCGSTHVSVNDMVKKLEKIIGDNPSPDIAEIRKALVHILRHDITPPVEGKETKSLQRVRAWADARFDRKKALLDIVTNAKLEVSPPKDAISPIRYFIDLCQDVKRDVTRTFLAGTNKQLSQIHADLWQALEAYGKDSTKCSDVVKATFDLFACCEKPGNVALRFISKYCQATDTQAKTQKDVALMQVALIRQFMQKYTLNVPSPNPQALSRLESTTDEEKKCVQHLLTRVIQQAYSQGEPSWMQEVENFYENCPKDVQKACIEEPLKKLWPKLQPHQPYPTSSHLDTNLDALRLVFSDRFKTEKNALFDACAPHSHSEVLLMHLLVRGNNDLSEAYKRLLQVDAVTKITPQIDEQLKIALEYQGTAPPAMQYIQDNLKSFQGANTTIAPAPQNVSKEAVLLTLSALPQGPANMPFITAMAKANYVLKDAVQISVQMELEHLHRGTDDDYKNKNGLPPERNDELWTQWSKDLSECFLVSSQQITTLQDAVQKLNVFMKKVLDQCIPGVHDKSLLQKSLQNSICQIACNVGKYLKVISPTSAQGWEKIRAKQPPTGDTWFEYT
jgi:hypothetical protein